MNYKRLVMMMIMTLTVVRWVYLEIRGYSEYSKKDSVVIFFSYLVRVGNNITKAQ